MGGCGVRLQCEPARLERRMSPAPDQKIAGARSEDRRCHIRRPCLRMSDVQLQTLLLQATLGVLSFCTLERCATIGAATASRQAHRAMESLLGLHVTSDCAGLVSGQARPWCLVGSASGTWQYAVLGELCMSHVCCVRAEMPLG